MKKQTAAILCTTLCTTLLLTGCGTKQEEQQAISSYEVRETTTQPAEPELKPEPEEEPQQEEPEVQEETIEKDTNTEAVSPALTFDTSIIYDEEGVTVTLDDMNVETSTYGRQGELTLSISNNNPDNKMVNFRLYCLINGYFISDSYITGNNADFIFYDIKAGESETGTEIYILNDPDFAGIVSPLVQSITCYYAYQIGSDGEWHNGHTIITNTMYVGDDLKAAYGDKVYEFDAANSSFEVYLKQIGDRTIATLIQVGDPDMDFSYYNDQYEYLYLDQDWDINGKLVHGGNHPTLTVDTSSYRTFEDGGICLFLIDTPESIRKELEIPNDEPLDVNLLISFHIKNKTGFGSNTEEITIPITVE